MFRFTETGFQHRGVTLRDLVGLFRRPEPLPAHLQTRECILTGCHAPATGEHFMCEPHEVAEQLDMYHPITGWGSQ